MKTCTKCKRTLSSSSFGIDRQRKDGLNYWCKECWYSYQHAHYLKNKEHKKEVGKKWLEANKASYSAWRKEYNIGREDKLREACQKHYNANKDKIAKRNSDRYYATIEESRKRGRENYAKNKHNKKYLIHRSNRRAIINNIGGFHTVEDIENIWIEQLGKCTYCGSKLKDNFHADHIIPISRSELGPTNFAYNIQLLCPTCNISKGAKTHEEYIAYLKTTGRYTL